MNDVKLEKLKIILNQFWWPINLSYQTKSISNITETLVEYQRKNFMNIKNYNICELYSLYMVLNYALLDLWEEEFNTVTWLDLYEDGYTLLNEIKSKIIER